MAVVTVSSSLRLVAAASSGRGLEAISGWLEGEQLTLGDHRRRTKLEEKRVRPALKDAVCPKERLRNGAVLWRVLHHGICRSHRLVVGAGGRSVGGVVSVWHLQAVGVGVWVVLRGRQRGERHRRAFQCGVLGARGERHGYIGAPHEGVGDLLGEGNVAKLIELRAREQLRGVLRWRQAIAVSSREGKTLASEGHGGFLSERLVMVGNSRRGGGGRGGDGLRFTPEERVSQAVQRLDTSLGVKVQHA